MSQDLSTHAKESISKLECLYEASKLGSTQRALAYNKSVSLEHKGTIIAQLCERLCHNVGTLLGFFLKPLLLGILERATFVVPITFDCELL